MLLETNICVYSRVYKKQPNIILSSPSIPNVNILAYHNISIYYYDIIVRQGKTLYIS